jgi:hypothetical protein
MKNHEDKVQSGGGIKYFCPMKCEGSKTYDQPGNCPVCNMKLVPVAGNDQKTKDQHSNSPRK